MYTATQQLDTRWLYSFSSIVSLCFSRQNTAFMYFTHPCLLLLAFAFEKCTPFSLNILKSCSRPGAIEMQITSRLSTLLLSELLMYAFSFCRCNTFSVFRPLNLTLCYINQYHSRSVFFLPSSL